MVAFLICTFWDMRRPKNIFTAVSGVPEFSINLEPGWAVVAANLEAREVAKSDIHAP